MALDVCAPTSINIYPVYQLVFARYRCCNENKENLMFFRHTAIALLLIAPTISYSQDTRGLEEMSASIRLLCNDELAFSTVVSAEGNLGVGGRLRVLGVGLGAKVSGSEMKNLHNLYKNTRYNPTECRVKMLSELARVFFPKSGSKKYYVGSGQNGVEAGASSDKGTFTGHSGPKSATGSSTTEKGVATCYSGAAGNPGPCVAQFN